MTTQEIYSLAGEMTLKEVQNVLRGWEIDNELESIKSYKSLVMLGDSEQLAYATVIASKINKPDNRDFYVNAYHN